MYRKLKGLSLKALAKAAGTSRQTVWRIENGRQEASIAMLRRLSAATGGVVTVNQLVEALSSREAAE